MFNLLVLLLRVHLVSSFIEFEYLGCYFLEEEYFLNPGSQNVEGQSYYRSKASCVSQSINDIVDSSCGKLILFISKKDDSNEAVSEISIV